MRSYEECVVSSLPVAVVTFGLDGSLVKGNPAACCVFGLDFNSEEERQTFFDHIDTKDTDKVRMHINQALNGQSSIIEYKFKNPLKKDGVVWLRSQCYPVYDSNGIQIGVTLFEKDITSQKSLLSELRVMKENLRGNHVQ